MSGIRLDSLGFNMMNIKCCVIAQGRMNSVYSQPSGVLVSVHALSYSSVYVLMTQTKCSQQLFHTDYRWINDIRRILWHLWRASWKNKEYGSSFAVGAYFKRLTNTKWMHLRKRYIYNERSVESEDVKKNKTKHMKVLDWPCVYVEVKQHNHKNCLVTKAVVCDCGCLFMRNIAVLESWKVEFRFKFI